MAWWATLGVGLGLFVLGGALLALRSPTSGASALEQDVRRAAPLLAQLQTGQEPSPDLLAAMNRSSLAPLLQALMDAGRQRRQALVGYQAQIEAVGLGEGLTPATLVSREGREEVRQKLTALRQALEGLVQQDARVQSGLDRAMAAWLQETPAWGDAGQRRALQESAQTSERAMAAFFAIEGDIVTQVERLLAHLDEVGSEVTVENSPHPELVFANSADLAFYRQTLIRLADLGRREQQLLADAQRAGGLHARHVGALLTASLDGQDG